jgi:hypothetical protein
MLQWIQDHLSYTGGIEFKQLEKFRGVLVYISRTYPSFTPYLKGIHLTLDSWRPWRKADGWKMSHSEIQARLNAQSQDSFTDHIAVSSTSLTPPLRVHPVPRLASDIQALICLTSSLTPTQRKVRPDSTAIAFYGFADASGRGFGSTLVINNTVHFPHGQWSSSYVEQSSNFRELHNLISAMEEAHTAGLLFNCELFMFMDNSTAESAYFKGSSTSPKLFDLVLRLRCLQMSGDLSIHVIHVAGTRTRAEGTDGLSRGDFSMGVMVGQDILSFVPLHLDVLQRAPTIRSWVLSWYLSHPLIWLSPNDWYDQGQHTNHCVWTPPPAAADVAIELLAKSKHKRPSHQHIIIVPRLLTYRWRKLLSKTCDLVFTIPVGTDVWELTHHEPLIIGVAFPLISHRPWRLRGTKLLESAERHLQDLPKTASEWGRAILCQLFSSSGGVGPLADKRGAVHVIQRRDYVSFLSMSL